MANSTWLHTFLWPFGTVVLAPSQAPWHFPNPVLSILKFSGNPIWFHPILAVLASACGSVEAQNIMVEFPLSTFESNFTDLWAVHDTGRHAAPLSKVDVSHSEGCHQSSAVLSGRERKHKDKGCVSPVANCCDHLTRPMKVATSCIC